MKSIKSIKELWSKPQLGIYNYITTVCVCVCVIFSLLCTIYETKIKSIFLIISLFEKKPDACV